MSFILVFQFLFVGVALGSFDPSAEGSCQRIMTSEANRERTFIMIKPDGVQRGLVGDIIKRFEQKGFKLVAMKFTQVNHFLT
jgi:hypothetical protein